MPAACSSAGWTGTFCVLSISWLGIDSCFFLSNRIKTITGGNDFGKHPSVTIIESYNLYGSVSYFLTKILPLKLAAGELGPDPYAERPKSVESDIKRNVILVIGESVRYHDMSLFGYPRETTPYFDSQVGKYGFIFRKAVASGVSTDVSIPYLINALSGPDQIGNMLSRKLVPVFVWPRIWG